MMQLTFVCTTLLISLATASAAYAESNEKIIGLPIINEIGKITLNGKHIALWGVQMLYGDQKCYREENPWNCGEESITNLTYFIGNEPISCTTIQELQHVTLMQCSISQDGDKQDIGAYILKNGWAMATDDAPTNYVSAQKLAQQFRRGIWTSQFQTPEDWRAGIEHYVTYERTPQPEAPTPEASETITGPNEYVIQSAPSVKNGD